MNTLVGGALMGGATVMLIQYIFHMQDKRRIKKLQRPFSNYHEEEIDGTRHSAVEDLIGDTPLVELGSLSKATGCRVLAKAEFLNPGGSVKDRVALQIIRDAEKKGQLKKGGTVYEGTAGSTGVSLAMLAKAKNYNCHICMPNDQAKEKSDMLEALGATVERVPPVSIVNREHFVNIAKAKGESSEGGFFANQFENVANAEAHYKYTGPEIIVQTEGKLDAFVCAAGTGGTIAGISCALKTYNENIKVFLVDPPGSSLYNKAEGVRLRNPFDTITEGIGINRLTNNFKLAQIDDAFAATDQEAVDMAAYLLRNEGLFLGSSSAVNCVGAVKACRKLGPGHTVVTVLCDGGHRALSKFWNPEFLNKLELHVTSEGDDLSFISFEGSILQRDEYCKQLPTKAKGPTK